MARCKKNLQWPRTWAEWRIRVLSQPFTIGALVLVILLVGCQRPEPGKPLGSSYEAVGRAEVWRVLANSQAETLGLKPGDIVISYNDEPVRTSADLARAESLSQGAKARSPITVVVLRDEQELTFQARPGPLGFIPVGAKFSGSLALALKDIAGHFNRLDYYDWLAALTGESFTFCGQAGDCWSLGPGTKDGAYLEEIGKLIGLTFRPVFTNHTASPETAAQEPPVPGALPVIKERLAHGQVLLVKGGWPGEKAHLWGVALRADESSSAVYGRTVNAGQDVPLSGTVEAVYEVVPRPAPELEPRAFLSMALDHALELGLAYADTGWKSGLDAYDLVLRYLDTVPFCWSHPEQSDACFRRLVWSLLASKESANRFLEEMKEALPDQAEMIEEIIGENRVIIGKLEGMAASRLQLGNLENQRKLGLTINEIQLLENELLGFYEELLGEL